MLSNIQKTGGKPPRILIYGPQKIGKSTFGSNSNKPVFIQTEDGLDALNADAFPLSQSYNDVMANITTLATEEHGYKTVVVDSLDHLEPLIWKHLCQEHNVKTIEEVLKGYGKGYVLALDLWREYLTALDYLRDEKDMTIIQIAHAHIKRFESPITDAYDKYEIKLHKLAAGLLAEKSDIILFANYWVGITKESESSRQKDDDKRKRAVGTGERILYTEERPAFIAGNRYSLPSEIQFTNDGSYWNILAQHIPYFNKPAQTEKDA